MINKCCMFYVSLSLTQPFGAEEGFICLIMWTITHILCFPCSTVNEIYQQLTAGTVTQRKCKNCRISNQVLKVFPVYVHISGTDLRAALIKEYDHYRIISWNTLIVFTEMSLEIEKLQSCCVSF